MTAARFAALTLAITGAIAVFTPAAVSAQGGTMVVYLPSVPNESASRVAASITELAAYLSDRTGLRIEAKAFRRAEDATEYLTTSADEAVLVMAEQPFLLDLPKGFEVTPAYRFVRAGRETRRKLVVVRTTDAARSLLGLRGRSLAVPLGAGRGSNAFVARMVFGGELDPERWFGRLLREPDDFTAVTNVLFGRADAALVSDDNPLVQAHIGKDLREIYTSRPVSLPVIAIRSTLRDAQRAAIEQALAAIPRAAELQAITAGLGIERFQRIPDGGGTLERAGLLRLPAGTIRTLEISYPTLTIDLPRAAPLAPDQIPFLLGVELLELPVPLPSIGGTARRTSGSERQ